MDTLSELERQVNIIQSNLKELNHRFNIIQTFSEAAYFDEDAFALINLYEKAKSTFAKYADEEDLLFHQEKEATDNLPFFKRLSASRKNENEHKENASISRKVLGVIDEKIEVLLEMIDQTPNSKNDQKDMLFELRQLKKELQLEKRETNEAVRIINAKARTQTAAVTGFRGRGIAGTIARTQRISSRYSKEIALSPHEQRKTAINRQLLEIDRKINWISKFSDGGMQYSVDVENKVLRCAYCGRRVEEGIVCKSCGSDETTYKLN